MNENTIGIKFKTGVDRQDKLERLAKNLTAVRGALKGIDTKELSNLALASKNFEQVDDTTKDILKTTNKIFSTKMLENFSRSLKNLTKTLTKYTKSASDFLENRNLFQVAFNGNYQSAQKFIDKMSEMYGLDESWLTNTVGIFKQLANAMGLSTEQGEKLSKLMSQMSLDISSLYNVDMDRASSVLQSALAG